jgi:hypothetical protein
MTGLSEAAMIAEGVDLAIANYEDPRLLPFAARHLGVD